jgi:outer membrane lipoprotein-sorting protein
MTFKPYPFKLQAFILGAFLATAASAKADPTPAQIAERLDLIRRPNKSFETTLDITEMHNGQPTQKSVLRIMARKLPDEPHFETVAICLEPGADKNKTVLTTNGEVWFLDPKSKHPAKVSPHQFRGKFFVTDAISTSFAADYDTELLGEETIQDAARKDVVCLHVRMKLKGKTSLTAEMLEFWVDKQNLEPIRGQFYTKSGKLQRTAYYAGYAKVLDEIRPTRVLIVSNTERGLVTDVKFGDITPKEWPAEMFTKDSMERVMRGELP